MPERYSPTDYYNALLRDHVPALSHRAWRGDFPSWQAVARDRLHQLLGDFPVPAPLEPQVLTVETRGELIVTKVRLTTDALSDMPVLISRRKDLDPRVKHPALVTIHGHGHQGKDTVVGDLRVPGVETDLAAMKNDYGRSLALAGFITISPDLRAFGERTGELFPDRDRCNVNFLKGAMVGVYPLTLNLADLTRCVDYLATLPDVDADRIGAIGLSYGGTLTTFFAAVEPRIRAADIVGYLNPFYEFAIRRANFCGSQMVPGLFSWFDTHDIAGLIAPRPVLLEMGKQDLCFLHEDLTSGYQALHGIYSAAKALDVLEVDDHAGGHEYSGRRAPEFFHRHLAARKEM